MERNIYKIGKKLFITSDEEIKEGDWYLVELFKITGESDGFHIEKCTKLDDVWCNNFDVISTRHKDNCKKIILTTDQDLINDGVQAIDDEFLEWFAKNPSCKYVETYSLGIENSDTGESGHYKYEIIIPKGEQKQHIIDIMKSDEELGLYEQTKCYCGHTTTCDCGPEQEITLEDIFNEEKKQGVKELIDKHKQETLEEAAIIYAHKSFVWPLNKQGEKQSIPPGQSVPTGYTKHKKVTTKHFINGAKWQEQKMYSEEEVLSILRRFELTYDGGASNSKLGKWFEQFKKK